MVGEVEKLLGLKFAFEPDRVQPHIFYIAEFVVQTLRVFAQHHVRSPAATANQNVLAIDLENATADRSSIVR